MKGLVGFVVLSLVSISALADQNTQDAKYSACDIVRQGVVKIDKDSARNMSRTDKAFGLFGAAGKACSEVNAQLKNGVSFNLKTTEGSFTCERCVELSN